MVVAAEALLDGQRGAEAVCRLDSPKVLLVGIHRAPRHYLGVQREYGGVGTVVNMGLQESRGKIKVKLISNNRVPVILILKILITF